VAKLCLNVFDIFPLFNQQAGICMPQIMKANVADPSLRVRAEITSQNWRLDLVQVWLIRESKTAGIASYSEDFASEASVKDGLKLRC
jgi:hypothetical protein